MSKKKFVCFLAIILIAMLLWLPVATVCGVVADAFFKESIAEFFAPYDKEYVVGKTQAEIEEKYGDRYVVVKNDIRESLLYPIFSDGEAVFIICMETFENVEGEPTAEFAYVSKNAPSEGIDRLGGFPFRATLIILLTLPLIFFGWALYYVCWLYVKTKKQNKRGGGTV